MKYEIEITTGRTKGFRERTFRFTTDEVIPLEYFTSRKSLYEYSFPRYVKGYVDEFTEGGGSQADWKDFTNFFEDLRAQNIFTVSVNGKDINKPIADAAKKYGATTKFPVTYHAQFFFETIPDWVFNWYPTTGTLSKQKTTDKFYRMQNLGVFDKVEDALQACK